MIAAISAIGPYYVPRVLGAHATISHGPIPVRPLEESTPALPTLRIMVYQLRPDGRGIVWKQLATRKVDTHA